MTERPANDITSRNPTPKSHAPGEPQAAEPLPIGSVNHVGVMTSRVAESRRFYREVLGFREVSRPNFDFDGAWLYNYGLMIHLIYNDAAGDPDGEIQTRDNHLALHADDLGRVEQLLRQHGIAYRKNEIVDRGIKQIFFQDPDGHHIEIGKYPPTPPYL
jgi:catechol 2,3-dioxygenase-like lactoylglutathione lyase family enzyme